MPNGGVTLVRCAEGNSGTIIGDLRWAGAPEIAFHLELTKDGRLLEWRAVADEGASIGVRQLREVPIGAMERALRSYISEEIPLTRRIYNTPQLAVISPTAVPDADSAAELRKWRELAADFARRPRPGVKGRSDESYAALAACYVAAFERGEMSPVRAVARELGIGETTIRNLLTKARERGLLTATEPGRAGGALTHKASRLLAGPP